MQNVWFRKVRIAMPFSTIYAFCKAKHLKEDKTNKSDSYIIFTVFA